MRIFAFATLLLAVVGWAQTESVLGNWKNPTGSVIQIYRCGPAVCARVIAIRSGAPTRLDARNPNPALRRRSLCGLQIGSGFRLEGPDRAQGGRLYDPESGKTYSGSMALDSGKLMLRGYVGFAIFGRTEVWTRAPANVTPCHS